MSSLHANGGGNPPWGRLRESASVYIIRAVPCGIQGGTFFAVDTLPSVLTSESEWCTADAVCENVAYFEYKQNSISLF